MAMSEKKEKETVTMTDPEDVLELHDLKSWFYTEKEHDGAFHHGTPQVSGQDRGRKYSV